MPRKPGAIEKKIIRTIAGFVPEEYLKAVRDAAERALYQDARKERA